jgi:hypothetical protein
MWGHSFTRGLELVIISHNNLPMNTILGKYITLVDNWVAKIAKIVSVNMETYTDTMVHVHIHYSITQHVESQTKGNGAN